MLSAFSLEAMLFKLMPSAWYAWTIGPIWLAKLSALAVRAALAFTAPLSAAALLKFSGRPNFTPRALSAANAALVLWLIISRSCSARAAKM